MNKAVLDASALLAFLNAEPGSEAVETLLEHGQAVISGVNLAEAIGKLRECGMPGDAVTSALRSLGLTVVAFDQDHAYRCGELRTLTRRQGLSLGDCACLTTAGLMKLPAVTADKAWLALDLKVEIRCIRPARTRKR
jgi:PIN domain nuclease of toxin-antitoxin system